MRPAGNGLLNSSKGQTVSQAGNSPPVRVILGAIISDQCRLCRESPCARPLPTLMPPRPLSWKVPWASVSLSIFFYQQEQGHFQSHTGSKSKPWAASLAGSKDSWFRASFINFRMIDPWGWIILYFRGSSVPCRMFSSIPTLCPLDIWAPLVTTTNGSRYCQVVPKGAKITPG